MTTKFNIPAFILSASLAAGGVFAETGKTSKDSIEQTKESALQVLSGKENMKRLREEIERNTTSYEIQKNDKIASIADHIGISTDELLDLNTFLDKSLVQRKKKK